MSILFLYLHGFFSISQAFMKFPGKDWSLWNFDMDISAWPSVGCSLGAVILRLRRGQGLVDKKSWENDGKMMANGDFTIYLLISPIKKEKICWRIGISHNMGGQWNWHALRNLSYFLRFCGCCCTPSSGDQDSWRFITCKGTRWMHKCVNIWYVLYKCDWECDCHFQRFKSTSD